MELFDKEDVISWSDCSEAKLSEKGYFGYSLQDLEQDIKTKKPRRLCEINEDSANPFKADAGGAWAWYPFFLPVYGAKEPTYRPLQSISELFAFMMPEYADKGYTTDDMIDLLLGQHYTLKDKDDGTIRYYAVNFLSVSAFGTIILDDFDLTYLFDKYEYRKGDEFIPFGIGE